MESEGCHEGFVGGSGGRRIIEPDLAAELDDGVGFPVGVEQRGQGQDEPADVLPAQRKTVRDAHDSVGWRAAPHRVGQQGAEVAEIPGDDGPLLLRQRREVDAVRPTPQIGPFPHGDDIVALRSELAGDLGREVLVEEQSQPASAS